MRNLLLGIGLFLLWGSGSTWWYVCKTKGLCNKPKLNVAADFYGQPEYQFTVKDPNGRVIWESVHLLQYRAGSAEPTLPENFPIFAEKLLAWQKKADRKQIVVVGGAHPDESDAAEVLSYSRGENLRDLLVHYVPELDSVKAAGNGPQPVFDDNLLTSEAITFILGGDIPDSAAKLADLVPSHTDSQDQQVDSEPSQSTIAEASPQEEAYPQEETTPTPEQNELEVEKEVYLTPKKEPAPVAPPQPAYADAPVPRTIYFSFAKPIIPDAGELDAYIQSVIANLAAHPERNVRISGHTDNTASQEANLRLGNKRADAIRDLLIAKGVDASRIETVSMGERTPERYNSSKEGRKRNRRAVIEII